MYLRPPEQLTHLVGINATILEDPGVPGRNASRHLAAHRPDLALELTHTTLARVVRDNVRHGVVGERDALVVQSVLLELARDQVFLRDLGLLAFRVPRE